eukprot:4949477-Pyramimonas_sp.AAC.1
MGDSFGPGEFECRRSSSTNSNLVSYHFQVVQYSGTHFAGFQYQPAPARTVQHARCRTLGIFPPCITVAPSYRDPRGERAVRCADWPPALRSRRRSPIGCVRCDAAPSNWPRAV